jgi:serine O-acetyltransferase
MSTLYIDTKKIGEGLFIPHGFSSTIGAASIGKNCSINHNVTIGTYGKRTRPIILDNVQINAGAVIFGNITIGNNVIIGANATVNTDIPDNCTVFPPPSRIMRWNEEHIQTDAVSDNDGDK